MISAASSLFLIHHFLLRENKQKSIILSHFSNFKFLFITAVVLNSARFDSILFCEKFEVNF